MKSLWIKIGLVLALLCGVYRGECQPLSPERCPDLEVWHVGRQVTAEQVRQFGEERCFAIEPISDSLFARIYGISYKADCTLPRTDLRYLKVLHYDFEGQICLGEMICHRTVAEDLCAIFRELYAAKYPIERMRLIDDYGADDQAAMLDNNSSAFNFRFISGTTHLSNHSWGTAVDINPLYNPYVRVRNGRQLVEPATSKPYADRTTGNPHYILRGDVCYRAFTKRGFVWGGDWKSCKDYQHFEKKQPAQRL